VSLSILLGHNSMETFCQKH